jgi:hypothetical protein
MTVTMNHYTYCIVFPAIPRLYIGVRSYNGPPTQDDYRSSSKKVKALIKEGFQYTISIIATHATRAEAEAEEIALHDIFDVARNPYFLNGAKARHGGFTRAGVPSDQKGRTYEELFGIEEAARKRLNLQQKLRNRVFSKKTKAKMAASHADVSGPLNPRAISGALELSGKILLEYQTKAELVRWCLDNDVPHRPILRLRTGDAYLPNITPRNAKFKRWFGLRVLEPQR